MPGPITKEMVIGEVIEEYPGTEAVFKKYFGKGCSECPGSKVEDIDFGSTMHNANIETVLRELNEIAAKPDRRKG
jgi:hybrid cluster-associated redox disulfide protein